MKRKRYTTINISEPRGWHIYVSAYQNAMAEARKNPALWQTFNHLFIKHLKRQARQKHDVSRCQLLIGGGGGTGCRCFAQDDPNPRSNRRPKHRKERSNRGGA